MALYEYTCPQCKKKFEELRGMEQGDNTKCPECGSKAERVMSVPSDYPHIPHFSRKDGEGFTSGYARSNDELAEMGDAR